MRKLILGLLLGGFGFFVSCSESDFSPEVGSQIEVKERIQSLPETRAAAIAEKVLSEFRSGQTRTSNNTPEVEYILRSEKTRSTEGNDTLAYIFNYPENGGYAIIAYSTEVDPLIAYSEKGHLDCNDEFVSECIIDPIKDYLIEREEDNLDNPNLLSGGDWNFGYRVVEEVKPQCLFTMNQRPPWNKLAAEFYGDERVLAGCVPTAMVYIMCNAKNTLFFNSVLYNFSAIRKAIAIHQGATELGTSQYTYEQALSRIQQLLWDVGVAVGTDTVPPKRNDQEWIFRSTNMYYAQPKLAEWGYTESSDFIYTGTHDNNTFDPEVIKNYISNRNIILIVGTGYSAANEPPTGHAWVMDGYQVRTIYNPGSFGPGLPEVPTTTYLYQRWGEDDNWDGYYSGNIYTLPHSTVRFYINDYCAYKNMSTNLIQ